MHSVRIIRKEDQVVQATYIKEFCIFTGIYVSEFIIGFDDVKSDRDWVDCNIILQEDLTALAQFPNKCSIKLTDLGQFSDLSHKEERITFGKHLTKQFLSIPIISKWEEINKNDLQLLWNVFINNDFAWWDYFAHTFISLFNKNIMADWVTILENCIESIYPNNATIKGLAHRRFAFLNCVRKREYINTILKVNRKYKTELLIKAACALDIDFFSQGTLLAGFIACGRRKYSNYGIKCLKEVLEKEGQNYYSAFIYWTLAQYLEKEERNDGCWEFYEKMLKITPLNCKINFKVITKLFEEKNYQKFFKELYGFYSKLIGKVKTGNSTPKELELFCRSAAILLRLPDNQFYLSKKNVKAVIEGAIESNSFNKNFLFDKEHAELCNEFLRRKTHYIY